MMDGYGGLRGIMVVSVGLDWRRRCVTIVYSGRKGFALRRACVSVKKGKVAHFRRRLDSFCCYQETDLASSLLDEKIQSPL